MRPLPLLQPPLLQLLSPRRCDRTRLRASHPHPPPPLPPLPSKRSQQERLCRKSRPRFPHSLWRPHPPPPLPLQPPPLLCLALARLSHRFAMAMARLLARRHPTLRLLAAQLTRPASTSRACSPVATSVDQRHHCFIFICKCFASSKHAHDVDYFRTFLHVLHLCPRVRNNRER